MKAMNSLCAVLLVVFCVHSAGCSKPVGASGILFCEYCEKNPETDRYYSEARAAAKGYLGGLGFEECSMEQLEAQSPFLRRYQSPFLRRYVGNGDVPLRNAKGDTVIVVAANVTAVGPETAGIIFIFHYGTVGGSGERRELKERFKKTSRDLYCWWDRYVKDRARSFEPRKGEFLFAEH